MLRIGQIAGVHTVLLVDGAGVQVGAYPLVDLVARRRGEQAEQGGAEQPFQ